MKQEKQYPYHSRCCRTESQRLEKHNVEPVPAGASFNCMALSCHTPVPTPDGWVILKDIAPGQVVFDQAGQPCTVVAVCQREPEIVYQVCFDDESILLAGAHHPWVTMRHQLRHRIHKEKFAPKNWAWSFDTPTTEELRDSLVFRSGTLVESSHSVPVAKPLNLPLADLPIDPYILGLWLGDGTSIRSHITCHRDDEPHYREKAFAAGEAWRVVSEKDNVLTCSLARGPRTDTSNQASGTRAVGQQTRSAYVPEGRRSSEAGITQRPNRHRRALQPPATSS